MKNNNIAFRSLKIFSTYLLLLCCTTLSAFAIERQDAVNNYVDELVQKAQNVLKNNSLTPEQCNDQSQKIIASNLDLSWMAKYTLGRYRKQLSTEKIQEFISVYSKYVVKTYSSLIKNYKGEQVKIQNVQLLNAEGKEYIVKTVMVKDNGQPPVKVDYLVREFNDNNTTMFRISDIITEGVSMINSQKSEFDNMLSNEDGINSLISTLKKKL